MRLQSVLLQVHVVLPQPGSNNAHRVDDKNKNKNIKVELVDKAQIIEDVPFAKEIFQVISLQTYEDLYFLRLLGPYGIWFSEFYTLQPEENSLQQSSLTLPPATLLKKSLNSVAAPTSSLLDATSSPPPPLPTAYIPALSTFAPPPPSSSSSVFSPPPKRPTTAATSSTLPSTVSTSSRPGGIRTVEDSSGDWQPQPRRPRGPRQQQFGSSKPQSFIKSSLRNHPGSIFWPQTNSDLLIQKSHLNAKVGLRPSEFKVQATFDF